MSLASAPVAARIGADVLARGGNAYDAVVASALAETVLLPPKCGLADVARRGELRDVGPTAVGVPGAPAGYLALAERASRTLGVLAAPAIELALEGFCWSAIGEALAVESAALVARHQPAGTRLFPDGRPLRAGEVVRLPGLALALGHLVDERDGFLAGEVGAAIVGRVRDEGGVLTDADLRTPRAEWSRPAGARDGRLHATPAPTHGVSLLDACTEDAGTGPSATLVAVRGAIARRRLSFADTSGTSMVSAVDAAGTMVAVVHSNSYPRFGSGLIVDEYDLVLANRAGRGFDPDPAHPNFPAPGRRPVTTLHAWGWETSAGWRVLGGTPGGANQMPWNAQVLARLRARDAAGGLDHDDLARAIVAPRWQHDPDGGVSAEDGFGDEDLAELRDAAADDGDAELRGLPTWAARSAMQLVAHDGTVAAGAVDPRTVGGALAV
ncbi:MAG: gamma-glutamyltransferase [Actinomycetota bacterium]|nr:gamma-glutamyltransferase [Actinomycetota bacterium]